MHILLFIYRTLEDEMESLEIRRRAIVITSSIRLWFANFLCLIYNHNQINYYSYKIISIYLLLRVELQSSFTFDLLLSLV